MANLQKNSFDLLRLFAAALVLYSHQHALLGLAEPELFGWTTLGGVGVSIFFFLSGLLVWSSWARDPDLKRFFIRRSLRIFPALWLVVFVTVFLAGPVLSNEPPSEYFEATQTWLYLSTGILSTEYVLPGVFVDNPFAFIVNGSLWTLPVEFLCYGLVSLIGWVALGKENWLMALSLCVAMLVAAFGQLVLGSGYVSHLEMVTFFLWGMVYGYVSDRPRFVYRGWALWFGLVFLAFLLLGSRGTERAGMLVVAAALVITAQHTSWGSRLTDRLGDLSYGMYIFAFPVQQIVVEQGRGRGWTFATYLWLSFLVTSVLAYVSWHAFEKRVLLFKPKRRAVA